MLCFSTDVNIRNPFSPYSLVTDDSLPALPLWSRLAKMGDDISRTELGLDEGGD